MRLDAAKLSVEEMLADLPVGGTASLVVAGERSEVLLSSSSDAAAIKRGRLAPSTNPWCIRTG